MAYLSVADLEHSYALAEKVSAQLKAIDINSIEEDLNKWKHAEVNIAFIGTSGSGKSTLINTLRGLNADDYGAATVGTDEETKEITPYQHPENKNVVLWDLPGVGTDNFPQDTYLSKIGFEKYDFFIIVSQSRFTEYDSWLVKNIHEQMKKIQGEEKQSCFYFVRTKIDNEVRSMIKNNPKRNFSSEQITEKMRVKAIEKLKSLGVDSPRLFLIDSLNPMDFDFGNLCSCFVSEAVGSKMEAMAYTLFIRTGEAFNIKKDQLKRRTLWAAVAATLAKTLPVFAYDYRQMLLDESQFYRQQFGVLDEQIDAAAKIMNLDGDFFRKKLNLYPIKLEEYETRSNVISSIIDFSKFSALKRVFLVFGSSVPTFHCNFCFLTESLEKAYKDGHAVNQEYRQRLIENTSRNVNYSSKL